MELLPGVFPQGWATSLRTIELLVDPEGIISIHQVYSLQRSAATAVTSCLGFPVQLQHFTRATASVHLGQG